MSNDDERKDPEILRSAHGNGVDAILRAEDPPLDERPPLSAEHTAKGLALAAQRGRPFQPGNSAGSQRKPALALLGVPIAAADPRHRSAMRKAASWRSRRVRELAVHCGGYLGTGPATMIASAALALAASRVAYELAAEKVGAEGMELAKLGAHLADKARQQELTAVGLAEREARARIQGTTEDTSWLFEKEAK
jgi:hypothetical protein